MPATATQTAYPSKPVSNLRDINVAGAVSKRCASECALPPAALPQGAAVTRVCQLYTLPDADDSCNC